MWILWQPHLGFEKITLAAEQSIIQGPKGRMYMWRQAEDLHILGERVKTLHSTEDPTLWSGSLLSRQPSLWEACLTAGREALCSELTPYMEKVDRLKIQPSNHQSFLSPCEWGPPTWNDENALVWGIWQNDLHISLKAFKYTQISPVLKQKQLSLFHLISALRSVRLVLPNTKCRQRHHNKTKKKKKKKKKTTDQPLLWT